MEEKDSHNLSCEAQRWKKFTEGDREAYARIYDTYFDVLCRYGCKISKDRELVLDTIQELFVSLWKNKANLTTPVSVQHYLLKALRRRMYRSIQSADHPRTHSPQLPYDHSMFSPSHEDVLIEEQTMHQRAEDVKSAMNSLTKREREVIFLRFYQNMSYEMVASVMDVSVPATYNLVSKSLKALQRALQHHPVPLLALVMTVL